MTQPKKFTKGKHTYTRWGPHFKEVRVEGKKKSPSSQAKPEEKQVSFDIDSKLEEGVYANAGLVYSSPDGAVLDFAFIPPGASKGKINSRVILPLKQVERLAKALTQTAENLKNQMGSQNASR